MPSIDRARVCVFGADHGVAVEGVSAYPRAVTAEMLRNFDRGGAAINVIAAANDVSVEVIDVGVDADLTMHAGIRHEKVRRGSRNCLDEPAMTEDELHAALEVGRAAARRAVADGVSALGLGEMGIGNTTVASALLSALTGHPTAATVGRGTGVSDDALARKREIVDRAIDLYASRAGTGEDTYDLLRCIGGLELAAIAGAAFEFLTRIPVHRWVANDVQDLTRAATYFPLVGVVVGAAGGLVFAACLLIWPTLLAIIVSVAATVGMTGAFHERPRRRARWIRRWMGACPDPRHHERQPRRLVRTRRRCGRARSEDHGIDRDRRR